MTGDPVRLAKRVGLESLARADQVLGLTRLYPGRANAILVYHAVGNPDRFGNVSVERLRRDLQYLTTRYDVVDLPAVLEPGDTNRVAITFDDAYDDFYDNALPVLRDFSVPVTLFVPVGFVGDPAPELAYRLTESPSDHDRFNDPTVVASAAGATSAPDPGVMSWDRLREVAATDLVTIGNHTATHPDLARLAEPGALDREIRASRDRLEDELGVTVDRFAFPFGRYCEESCAFVRGSHACSVTSEPGVVSREGPTDPHCLPRIRAHQPEHRARFDLTLLRWQLLDRLDAAFGSTASGSHDDSPGGPLSGRESR
jgi:peptidoglycan/xylan/chitin deacetylase (PgdA/CDA1 family)